jgi:aquaporin Z
MASSLSASHSVMSKQTRRASPAAQALTAHWPEYLMEAAALGSFMISACTFGVLLEHPASPLHQAIPDPNLRRALAGMAMGLTLIAIVYSPWGKQSGAHLNPVLTFTFLLLGKVARWDALFYGLSQFAGGVLGVFAAALFWRTAIADPHVNYAVTLPGPDGAQVAFLAEVAISFLQMLLVLTVSNSKRFSRFTGVFAGAMVATYITLESPLSGMSMNPARTFGSAFLASEWRDLWIYFTAPLLGMLAAGAFYRALRGSRGIFCAKLHHHNDKRCIFHCNFKELGA